MPDPQAQVGIEFSLHGMDETLRQISTLQEAIGQLGRVSVNPYNPSLQHLPVAQGTFAGDNPPPVPFPGASGGAASPYYPSASQTTSYNPFSGNLQSITISQVQTLNVQNAAVVNVYGSGRDATSPISSPVEAARPDGYFKAGGVWHMPDGRPTPFGPPPLDPAPASAPAPPASSGSADPDSPSKKDKENEFTALARTQVLMHSMGLLGNSALHFSQASTGYGAERRAAGYIGGVGGFLQGAGGVAMLVPGGQVAGAALMGVGTLAQIGSSGLNQSISTAEAEGLLLRQNTRGLEGWNSSTYQPFGSEILGSLNPNRGDFLYSRARESGLGVREFLTLRSAFAAMADDPNGRNLDARVARIGRGITPQEAEFVAQNAAEVERLAFQPGRAGALGRVRRGEGFTAGDVESEMALAALNGDFDTLSRLEVYSNNQGLRMGGRALHYRNVAGRSLDFVARQQLGAQQIAFGGLEATRAQVTHQGSGAVSGAMEREETAIRQQIALLDRQIAEADQAAAAAPGNLELQRRANELRLQRDQLSVQADASPFARIQARTEGALSLSQSQSQMGATGLQLAQGTGQLRAGGAFAQQRQGLEGSIAALERQLREMSAQPGISEERLAPIRAALTQSRAQLALLPVQEMSFNYSQALSLAGAQTASGQAGLMLQDTLRVSGRDLDFSGIRSGINTRLAAAQERLQRARSLGLGPVETAQAEADVRQAQAEAAAQPYHEIDARFGADSRNASFLTQGGQSQLSIAGRHELFGGAGTQRAQSVIMAGLNEQLEAALRAYQELLSKPHTAGQAREAQGRIDAAKAAIDGQIAAYIQSVAQDQFMAAGHSGALARAGVQGAVGAGFAPSAEQQGAVSAGLDAQIAQAHANARNAVDPRQRMFWQQQAAALEAERASLPLRQIEERLSPGARSAQAGMGVASAELSIARAGGLGSAETRDLELSGVREAEAAAQVAAQRVRERRELARQGRIDPSLVREAEAQEAQARARATQMRTALGDVALPLSMRERKEETSYALRVLETVPGAFGNVRGLLMGQMSQLNEEAAYLQNELQTRGPELTEEGRAQIRRRLREVGIEQAGAFQQLSTGWENRLVSRMIGSPGSFNLEGRGLSLMSAIVGGNVTNPHMGMNAQQLPFFLQQASLAHIPFAGPGVRGYPGSDGIGVFGPVNPLRTAGLDMRSARPGLEMGGDLRSGGGEQVLRLEVTIKDASGAVLGTGTARRQVSAGDVSQALETGGLTPEILQQFGLFTAQQQ